MTRIVFLLILLYSSGFVIAQNCLGTKNLDVLNIAKQFNPERLINVLIDNDRITAAPDFKFVQLRNTETFILVPEGYQDRVIDFNMLLPGNSRLPWVLDLNQLTARLICRDRSGSQTCRQERLSKNSVGCKNCGNLEWITAPALSEKAILIPVYKKR